MPVSQFFQAAIDGGVPMAKYRPMKQILSVIVALGLAGSLTADDSDSGIYRSKDRQGNTVFTDQPGDNAERVELQDTNRTPAVTPRPARKKSAKKDPGSGYVVSFVEPEDNAVVPNGLIPTTFSVTIDPPLLPKHKLEFLLDGESLVVGPAQHHTIDRLTPGGHQITAQVVDADGKPLGEAGSVRVTAYWPGNR